MYLQIPIFWNITVGFEAIQTAKGKTSNVDVVLLWWLKTTRMAKECDDLLCCSGKWPQGQYLTLRSHWKSLDGVVGGRKLCDECCYTPPPSPETTTEVPFGKSNSNPICPSGVQQLPSEQGCSWTRHLWGALLWTRSFLLKRFEAGWGGTTHTHTQK